jgi:carboxyl-terminal processing protease
LSANIFRLSRAFALCAGLAFMGHTALADEASPVQTSGPAQVSDIQTFLNDHSVPKSEGLAELIQRTLFRTARDYYTPLKMDELERDAIEGMRRWIEDAPADLAKARQALADAEKTLHDRTAEKNAHGDATAINPSDLARMNDSIIEARDARDDAADAVKAGEERLVVTPEKLLAAGLNHAFHELDPHSDYLPPGNPMLSDTPQKARIGIVLAVDGLSRHILSRGLLVRSIMHPQDNSPARRAGVLPGDLITSIDGVPLAGMPLRDAIKKLEGAKDTKVALGIERDIGPVLLSVTREDFRPNPVTWQIVDNNVVAINIDTFINAGTTQMFTQAIQAAQSQLHGAENVAGYVVDLRNDGGGLVDEAQGVLDVMIDGENFDRSYGAVVPPEVLQRNSLVTTQGRNSHDKRLTATPGDLMGGKPKAVLINGGSASASEIVAGAAQDFGATIVGINSFGKATFQAVMSLPDGAADPPAEIKIGQFKVTGGRYVYGPQDRSPQWTGVVPDVRISFMEASERRESQLPHALPPPDGVQQTTRAQRVCDKDGTVPPADANLVDPRTGEIDYELACAAAAVLGRSDGLGVRVDQSAAPAPLP